MSIIYNVFFHSFHTENHTVKSNLSNVRIFILLILVPLVCFQTILSNFVVCIGEDGHVDFDMSLTDDALATEHHLHEHESGAVHEDETVIAAEHHRHRCYDLVISFCAEYSNDGKTSPDALIGQVHAETSNLSAGISCDRIAVTGSAISHAPPTAMLNDTVSLPLII
jgi:hypothetical protein